MSTELYLDTARLGQMCDGARMAEQDFVKLVSQLRSSLYFGQFLTNGFDALSSRDRRKFPALDCWTGVTQLKRDLGRLVAQSSCPVFPFSQSNSVIRFAAECLFRVTSTVLTTDLAWPPYLDVLQQVAAKHNATVKVVRLSRMVFDGGAGIDDIVSAVMQAYRSQNCGGLFLSDISYLGIRLPIGQITNALVPHASPFVVVDGAQAFAQRPVNIQELRCDLYLAGTQKWLSAYHPLRLAIVGRPDSLTLIRSVRGELSRSPEFYDPLLDFSDEVEREEFRTFGATVNLIPLITAAGAMRRSTNPRSLERYWEKRRENARTLIDHLCPFYRWGGRIQSDLQSGIVIVPAPRVRLPTTSALTSIRSALKRYRIAATILPDGDLRLAMPSFKLSSQHLIRIGAALHSCRRWA